MPLAAEISIILFERPVRIGDLVTIGTTSGTVVRIKIRAITITDFDNFVVLVPSKMFIAETVQNRTLTSAVTRVTLKVGIAYGSNVEQAQKLMRGVAAANARGGFKLEASTALESAGQKSAGCVG